MCLEFGVPLVHTIDLMLVLTLTRALRNVTLSPLAETSSDLLCAFNWIFTIVTIHGVINFTSLTLWTTMGKLIFIIETTSMITTIEITLHTFSIGGELGNPSIL